MQAERERVEASRFARINMQAHVARGLAEQKMLALAEARQSEASRPKPPPVRAKVERSSNDSVISFLDSPTSVTSVRA